MQPKNLYNSTILQLLLSKYDVTVLHTFFQFRMVVKRKLIYCNSQPMHAHKGAEPQLVPYMDKFVDFWRCSWIFKITHTRHTHTTVLRPSWILSGTTRVSRHQKGKTRKVKPIWIYWSKRC